MQIQHIQAFVMLSQVKNISKCSQLLHITQQGLSRQISAIEHELGTQLFTRTSKGVELTKEGEVLLPGFEEAWKNYNLGLRALSDYQKSHQETIRVAVCPGIKQAVGLDFFKRFQIQNPNIRLKMEFQSDVACEDALYQDQVDAAFLDWPIHKYMYDSFLVVKSPLVAVMRKDDILASRSSLSMLELSGRNVYIPDDSHRMAQRFAQYWPDFYRSVIIDFTTNDYDTFYKELPKSGGGIALTFRFLCDKLDPELIAIPVEEESYVELFYCVKKNHTKNSALNRFSNYIYERIKRIE